MSRHALLIIYKSLVTKSLGNLKKAVFKELGFESIKCRRKCMRFFNIVQNREFWPPSEDVFSKVINFFNTRFTDDSILTVYHKNVSKLPFFPYQISECNKIYLSARRTNSLPSIKNSLLKKDRLTPNFHFFIYNRNTLQLITGFRFRLSHFNEQKFDYNLPDGIKCSCSMQVKINVQFFPALPLLKQISSYPLEWTLFHWLKIFKCTRYNWSTFLWTADLL